MGFIVILLAALALLAMLWLVGANEPVYRIVNGAAWFVAIRGADAPLAPNVIVNWSADADFSFIGGEEAYWSRFYVLAGGDRAKAPIDAGGAEDVYIARVAFGAPPKLALGLLRVLVMIGVLGKPAAAGVSRDLQSRGYRGELMPDAAAVGRLLDRPANYGPSMVNFLSYFPTARYGDRSESSGRAAYGRYGMVAMRTVYRTGGRLLFYGRITEVLREPTGKGASGAWSDVAAMHYPNPSAILSMENVPEYRAALHHRDAGLARTIVIASTDRGLTRQPAALRLNPGGGN